MNTPVLIPARNDVESWKMLLNKCPPWLLCMQFTKSVTRGSTRPEGLRVFTHPACVKACKQVIEYNEANPRKQEQEAPRENPRKRNN